MFPTHRESTEHLTETATFKQFLDVYIERKGLSENKLAYGARMNQKRLNNISNGVTKDVDVPTLVAICLVLELDYDETKDLMARHERAFSPANPVHRYYEMLIERYSHRKTDYRKSPDALDTALDEADAFLEKNNMPGLPNIYQ